MIEDLQGPRFLNAGDCGLVVEFGDAIDPAINDRVLELDAALAAAALAGLRETVPTYRSLLVLFDPRVLRRNRLRACLADLLADSKASARSANRRRWHFPVCYGGSHGEDLDHVAALHELSTRDVIDLHSGAEYRVYMIGFMPGFSYLGGLPEALHTSRRTTPRQKTPARSISIGGKQAAVSPPLEIPSGWQMLGQTPVRVYDPTHLDDPFLLRTGDLVCFEPIREAEYVRLCKLAEAGEPVARLEDVTADVPPVSASASPSRNARNAQ